MFQYLGRRWRSEKEKKQPQHLVLRQRLQLGVEADLRNVTSMSRTGIEWHVMTVKLG